jgi:hypothetical protein
VASLDTRTAALRRRVHGARFDAWTAADVPRIDAHGTSAHPDQHEAEGHDATHGAASIAAALPCAARR